MAQPAHARVRRRRRLPDRRRGPGASWSRPGTGARPPSTPRWSRPGRCRPGPGIAPDHRRGRRDAGWQLAVASTSAEPSVRAVLEHAVGAGAGRPSSPVLRRRRRAGQEAGPGHLPARRRAARRRPGRGARGRGHPQRAARRDRRRPAPAWSRSTATPRDEDFTGAALVVSSPRRPGRRAGHAVLANRSRAPTRATFVDARPTSSRAASARTRQEEPMTDSSFDRRRVRRPDHRADRRRQREVLRRSRRGRRRRRLRLLAGPRLRDRAVATGTPSTAPTSARS